MMTIRLEAARDRDAIAAVTAQAFDGMRFSDQTEPAIIAALRDAGALSLSLVAEEAREVIGHIAFSRVTIAGEDLGWFGLGPVSIRPDRQRGGVGSSLIRHGLHLLRSQGAAGCVLVGEPDYYRRFGFENDPDLRYEGVPAEYFMAICFAGSAPAGRVAYHGAFGSH